MTNDPPEDISMIITQQYVIWAISDHDFILDRIMLKKIVNGYTSPYRYFLSGENVLHLIWQIMRRRRADFIRDVVVATDLLNLMLSAFCVSSMLRCTDHGLASHFHGYFIKTVPWIEILDMCQEFGCVPDLHTYMWAAGACQHLSEDDPSLREIRQNMFDHLLRTQQQQPVEQPIVSKMLRFFCTFNQLKFAHAVYRAAVKENQLVLEPPLLGDVINLIRLLSYKDETLCLAVHMLADLSSSSGARTSKGSAAAFSSVVTGLCRLTDVIGTKELMEEMILKGPPPEIQAFNALLKSLCLTGDLEGAFHMLQLTESSGLKPDLGSYKLLIKGFKKRGMIDHAPKVMSMATNKHPNSTMN